MLPIFLCDDIKENLCYLKHVIEQQIFIEEMDMKIVCAVTSGEELLRRLNGIKTTGLYFIDVELKNGMNGFSLAEQIRKIDPRGFVVFITTHEEMSYLAFEYQVEAMDYILKERVEEVPGRILNCLKKAQERVVSKNNNIHRMLKVKAGEKTILVSQEDIYCITSCVGTHKVRIYTPNGRFEYSESLQQIEKQLSKEFVLCHKSWIVNLKYLDYFNEGERKLYLKNHQVCPVSFRQMATVRKKLMGT